MLERFGVEPLTFAIEPQSVGFKSARVEIFIKTAAAGSPGFSSIHSQFP
jgi:hypothetical protein